MTYKIGVFGSAAEILEEQAILKAEGTGKFLGLEKVDIINGACTGLPYIASKKAFEMGSRIFGYSPCTDLKGQKEFTPNDDLGIYEEIFYTPKSFEFADNLDVCKKYRNVISTANCNAGIIISGRFGTMNEFTNLFDMGKVIGVLERSGGIADEIKILNAKIKKKSKAKIVFSNSAEKLVKLVLEELKLKK